MNRNTTAIFAVIALVVAIGAVAMLYSNNNRDVRAHSIVMTNVDEGPSVPANTPLDETITPSSGDSFIGPMPENDRTDNARTMP